MVKAIFPNSPEDTIRVLQFTDTHLFSDPHTSMLGIDTTSTFTDVVEYARRAHWPADAIIATGDLVHDGSESGYLWLQEYLEDQGIPAYCIPGNHDDPEVMDRLLCSRKVKTDRHVRIGNWQCVFLNTHVPNNDEGCLAAGELALLEKYLTEYPGHHALIALHHPPVNLDSPWIDNISLTNRQAFFDVLNRHRHVRGVIWGHAHQEFDQQRDGIRLMGAPSTCFQFQPRLDKFGLDGAAPGYRWLLLHADGAIESGVQRIDCVYDGVGLDMAEYF